MIVVASWASAAKLLRPSRPTEFATSTQPRQLGDLPYGRGNSILPKGRLSECALAANSGERDLVSAAAKVGLSRTVPKDLLTMASYNLTPRQVQ